MVDLLVNKKLEEIRVNVGVGRFTLQVFGHALRYCKTKVIADFQVRWILAAGVVCFQYIDQLTDVAVFLVILKRHGSEDRTKIQ